MVGKGRPGPAPTPTKDLHSWRAKAREKAAKAKEPRAWSRDRPGPRKVIPPAKAIMLIPGYDPHRDAEDCKFVAAEGRRVVQWFHRHLTHAKGTLAGQAYQLTPLEQGALCNLFGWKRPDGTRRYRKCFIYVARKWGKTLFAAGLSLYLFFEESEDGEYIEGGVESYAAASTRDQAKLLWGPAKQMIRNDEDLAGRCRIYQGEIVRFTPGTETDDGSSFKAISAEANSAHGLNPYGYVLDELHTQPDGELLDVLDTGTASRKQPLGVLITTADYDRESICNEEYAYAVRVRDGKQEQDRDPYYLPVICETDKGDDWTDPANWLRANPKFPITPTREYMESRCRKAKQNPRFLNTFLRLNLNQRTATETAWFHLDAWDLCEGAPYSELAESLRGQPCEAGLDLAKKIDLNAFALFFPEQHALLLWAWIPEATAAAAELRDRTPYTAWTRDGWLEQTGGNVADYDHIQKRILQITTDYNPTSIGYDPWSATQMALNLQGEGLEMVEMRQGYGTLSGPCKELERLVVGGMLQHGGHPVLRNHASNVMVREDPNGNLAPDKKKSTGRIDGIVASVMAIGRAIVSEGPQTSVYETGAGLWL